MKLFAEHVQKKVSHLSSTKNSKSYGFLMNKLTTVCSMTLRELLHFA